jgi:hypothetical protein
MKAGRCVIPCIFVPVLFLFGNKRNILSLKGFIILFLPCSAYPGPMIDNYPARPAASGIEPAADSAAAIPAS